MAPATEAATGPASGTPATGYFTHPAFLWDVHHGNGTQDGFWTDGAVLMNLSGGG